MSWLSKIAAAVFQSEKEKARQKVHDRIMDAATQLKLAVRTNPMAVDAAIDAMAFKAWSVADEML
jgi:hypothetical protein